MDNHFFLFFPTPCFLFVPLFLLRTPSYLLSSPRFGSLDPNSPITTTTHQPHRILRITPRFHIENDGNGVVLSEEAIGWVISVSEQSEARDVSGVSG